MKTRGGRGKRRLEMDFWKDQEKRSVEARYKYELEKNGAEPKTAQSRSHSRIKSSIKRREVVKSKKQAHKPGRGSQGRISEKNIARSQLKGQKQSKNMTNKAGPIFTLQGSHGKFPNDQMLEEMEQQRSKEQSRERSLS